MGNRSSCSKYSPATTSNEFPLIHVSNRHPQQRLVEESICGTTSKLLADKTLDSFLPKSESEFIEYAGLITNKLRSFEKSHHFVALLKAVNELSLGALTAADTEEIASLLFMIAKEKRKSHKDADAGKQNSCTGKKHLHMDKPCHGSVFNRLVLRRFRKPIDVKPLPDGLLLNILSRLPAKYVLRCRLVCRKWHEVISTPSFTARHMERAPTILIVHEHGSLDASCEGSGLFFLDGVSKKNPLVDEVARRLFPYMATHYSMSIHGCNGLLLQATAYNNSRFFICNPFTREELLVKLPYAPEGIYGFFYHPDVGEYRLLCGSREGDGFRYMIFNIGTGSWRRLNNIFSYRPASGESHVMANRLLHWKAVKRGGYMRSNACCKEFIMVFNIDTEEFTSKSHPGEEGCLEVMHQKMHLIEAEGGKLLFGHVSYDTLNVWTLEDYAGWGWERKYRIDLRWNVLRKPFLFGVAENIRPICIKGNQLFIVWDMRGAFLYHLKRDIVKKVTSQRWKRWTCGAYVGLYKKTFVSLKGAGGNCV